VHERIIVIGASAGGIEALETLLAPLPEDLPAAIFVVVHLAAHSPGVLPHILNRAGRLRAAAATDGERIRPGHIYVAPADRHMLLEDHQVRIVRGAKENRHRPAIDPLFRSAAATYRERVIGVVLSGMLDDGSAGLLAIKRCGGIAVIQDPRNAAYSGMPESAMRTVKVDHCLPVAELGNLLESLARMPVPRAAETVPEDVRRESAVTAVDVEVEEMDKIGPATGLTCPECGGGLWEVNGKGPLRFRCNTGHAYSVENLLVDHSEAVERALFAAVRAMQQRSAILCRIAARYRERFPDQLDHYRDEAAEQDRHIGVLRQLLGMRNDTEARAFVPGSAEKSGSPGDRS
jgi:two-component system chemotaxis response regulator CheB